MDLLTSFDGRLLTSRVFSEARSDYRSRKNAYLMISVCKSRSFLSLGQEQERGLIIHPIRSGLR